MLFSGDSNHLRLEKTSILYWIATRFRCCIHIYRHDSLEVDLDDISPGHRHITIEMGTIFDQDLVTHQIGDDIGKIRMLFVEIIKEFF